MLGEMHPRTVMLSTLIFVVTALHVAMVSSAPLYVRQASNATSNQSCSYFPKTFDSCCDIQRNMMNATKSINTLTYDTKTSNNTTDNAIIKETVAKRTISGNTTTNMTTTGSMTTNMTTANDTTMVDTTMVNTTTNVTSGVYNLDHYGPFSATYGYCDLETDGGGWLVVFRRVGQFDFQKELQEYEDGFGELEVGKTFWYGLKSLNHITSRDSWELRVDLINENKQVHAHYASISVGDASEGYELRLGPHVPAKSTASDSFQDYSGQMFLTVDHSGGSRCPEAAGGGWWYITDQCGGPNGGSLTAKHSHLSGWYDEEEENIIPYKHIEMKIRQTSCTL